MLGHLPIVAPAARSFPADRPATMFWGGAVWPGLAGRPADQPGRWQLFAASGPDLLSWGGRHGLAVLRRTSGWRN